MPNGSEPYTHVNPYQMLTGYRLIQWIGLQILDFDLEIFTNDDRNELASELFLFLKMRRVTLLGSLRYGIPICMGV